MPHANITNRRFRLGKMLLMLPPCVWGIGLPTIYAQTKAHISGSVEISGWHGRYPPGLLEGLDVQIVSTEINTRSERPYEVQTADGGMFSYDVEPGFIRVYVQGRRDNFPKQGQFTYLVGEYPDDKSATKYPHLYESKLTLLISPSIEAKATSTKRSTNGSGGFQAASDQRAVHLVAYVISPRTHHKSDTETIGAEKKPCVSFDVLDDESRAVKPGALKIGDFDSFSEKEAARDQATGLFVVCPKGKSAAIVRINSPGFKPRTLLAYQDSEGTRLFDEESRQLDQSAVVKLEKLSEHDGESPDIVHIVDVDTSRRTFIESSLIEDLPLKLFTDPDIVVSLSAGYASPPEAFGHIGPS